MDSPLPFVASVRLEESAITCMRPARVSDGSFYQEKSSHKLVSFNNLSNIGRAVNPRRGF
jgi:hypothetical protein